MSRIDTNPQCLGILNRLLTSVCLAAPARTAQLVGFALAAMLFATTLSAADGDLDLSFSDDGMYTLGLGSTSEATAVAGLDDDSILVAGSVGFSGPNLALVKLLPSGSLDPEFGTGGSGRVNLAVDVAGLAAVEVLGVYPLANGRILLSASATTLSGDRFVVARLLASGAPDLSFGPGGMQVINASPAGGGYPMNFRSALTANGSLIFAGICDGDGNGCGVASHVFAIRISPAGTLDTSFGVGGWALFAAEPNIEIQSVRVEIDSQGRLVIAGNVFIGSHEMFISRLTAGGVLDASFGGGDGIAFVDFPAYSIPYGLAIDPVSGRILLAVGNSGTPTETCGIMALTSQGDLETGFGFGGVTPLTLEEGTLLHAIALQSDGKIVAVGWIDHTGTQTGGFYLVRLLSDGGLDSSFDDNGVARYEFDINIDEFDSANAVALVGGRLVAVGLASYFANSDFAILRTESSLIFADGFERGSAAAW